MREQCVQTGMRLPPRWFSRLKTALLPASVKLTVIPILRAVLVIFKHLGSREMLIRTYGTQRLLGPSVPDRLCSSTSPSLNHAGATVRDMVPRYPHRPYIWPIEDGRRRSQRGLGGTTNLEIMTYRGYLPPS